MMNKLNSYNQKRDFAITIEPEGIILDTNQDLRFVVQHHLARRDHYDFRLEWHGVLLSWAVPKGPSYNTKDKRLAVQVEDHPLAYRNFEGVIPAGEYGGGEVMLWDEGFWEPYGNVSEDYDHGVLKFTLHGSRLKGKWALIRLKKKANETKDNWLLLKEKDEYAKTTEGISEFITSIRTGRTMEEIKEGAAEKIIRNPFHSAGVQLAKLVSAVPEEDNWLYELKYDGYRILAYLEGANVRLVTRNGNDYTKRFSSIAKTLIEWANGRAMVLDGEMVIIDAQGKTDFQALQNYLQNPQSANLVYIIFDLLALAGEDLRGQPLIDRKTRLEALMEESPKNLYYSRHILGNGEESLAAACEGKLEGVIGKKADSLYGGTRNADWIKLKCTQRQEFVIGGYTLSAKKVKGISSLLLGYYEEGELIYAGRAGTGFSEANIKALEARFAGITRMTSPFQVAPRSRANEKITWLEPKIGAEIKFAEWTKDNLLRQASFKGLREDKSVKEIGGEKMTELIIEGIKITNPDKVIFTEPTITKAEVIHYYAKIAERMLPYVSRRILSIVRCPKGIAETCFYKKHPVSSSQGIVTIPVTNSDGETEDYFYIESVAGLIAEAQMGTLEFHTWGSSVEALEMPDQIVFDLDPDEGLELSEVRQGVRDLQEILVELSLKSYLKTSGGKGYHVVVPLMPVVSWDVVHDFAKGVVQVMEQKWPNRYTSNVRKASRVNKIFIDWLRNGRGATSVAAYSLRARKGAKVSMPIAWEELDTVAPDGIDMSEALRRLEDNDPWKDFFRNSQQLK